MNTQDILNQLKNDSLEDVYSTNFANKTITIEIIELKRQSFLLYYDNCNEFNKRKIKDFTDTVEDIIENDNLKVFPSYLKIYLDKLYRPNGLKNYGYNSVLQFILSSELELNQNLDELVSKFEENLIQKPWLTSNDKKLWADFKEKRKKILIIEEYIYSLEHDLRNDFSINSYDPLEESKYLEIHIKHINALKLEIAEINLFENSKDKIPYLEMLIAYFFELSKIPINYWNRSNEKFSEKSLEKIQQTFKLNLLHQFGIIEFLKQVWTKNNVSMGLEFLIEKLINEPHGSIQPRLSSKQDPKLRTKSADKKLQEFLDNFKLEIDKIKLP
ncbi:MAG: hypothetical protein IPQ02_05195 [Saprospiraceae bacterium]|nr:hypothetical protein [Candidatus Defluviibacterium haderslevense]